MIPSAQLPPRDRKHLRATIFPPPFTHKSSNDSSDLHCMEHIAMTSNRATRLVAATNGDLERLAQNRDNAKQRYKEKKKTRR